MLKMPSYDIAKKYLNVVNDGRRESYYGREGDRKIIKRLKDGDYDGYSLRTLKYVLQMGVWDKYLDFVPRNDTFVNSLHYLFKGKDYLCENWRPLGAFKDYVGFTAEEIYEKMNDRAVNTTIFVDGVEKNIIDLFVDHLKYWKAELGFDHIKFTKKDVIFNFVAMNARGIPGILTEDFVLGALKREYADYDNLVFEAAPDHLETHDIDIIIKDNSNDSKYYVSVKHGRAFSDSSISEYRFNRGKVKPDYYMDFQDDYRDGKLLIKVPNDNDNGFVSVSSIF